LHCHFSGIQYTDKGERKHLPITGNKPNFRWLAELLVEKNYKFTIICESPLLDKDALKMKQIVEKLKSEGSSSEERL
jgi:deoxyribonuclease-4